MAQRPPFNLLRAVFWLLAIIMIIELLASVAGGVLCWVNNYLTVKQPGACVEVGTQIRELWSELLTAILALLLAARPGGPPPDQPPTDHEQDP